MSGVGSLGSVGVWGVWAVEVGGGVQIKDGGRYQRMLGLALDELDDGLRRTH